MTLKFYLELEPARSEPFKVIAKEVLLFPSHLMFQRSKSPLVTPAQLSGNKQPHLSSSRRKTEPTPALAPKLLKLLTGKKPEISPSHSVPSREYS